MEVENLLHQAYVDQLQGNIDGCLTKWGCFCVVTSRQVQAMSILEDAKSHCSEEELPALSLKLDNIASEFNMIRSMHPEVEVQIHAEPEALSLRRETCLLVRRQLQSPLHSHRQCPLRVPLQTTHLWQR